MSAVEKPASARSIRQALGSLLWALGENSYDQGNTIFPNMNGILTVTPLKARGSLCPLRSLCVLCVHYRRQENRSQNTEYRSQEIFALYVKGGGKNALQFYRRPVSSIGKVDCGLGTVPRANSTRQTDKILPVFRMPER